MEKISVMIVDDHPVVRQGLRSMLANAKDIEVVAEASTGVEALRRVASSPPDVVLLDVQLVGVNGVQVAQQIRQMAPCVKVIILTVYDDDEYVFGALKAGAHGYLLKNVAERELEAAVRTVHQGGRLIGQDLTGKVLAEFERIAKEKARYDAGLSDQELQVLSLIAQGATGREIATRTYCSTITVKRKVHDICSKLGVCDRTQAVVEAMRRGLI
ncbi:MAG: response regulator transcription factor [Chloroflexi bacterium]|nr:response regulator transcription factor [Chloroflexota bacterium]